MRFVYGTVAGTYTDSAVAAQSPVIGSAAVSSAITGLTSARTYYYRVRAYNVVGSVQGSEMSFTTGAAVPPTATTSAATVVTQTTATLNGTVNGNGTSTTVRFVWGTVAGTYTDSTVAAQSPLTGNSPVSSAITGLAAARTYYYRVRVYNALGSVQGTEMSFTTSLPGVGGLVAGYAFDEGTGTIVADASNHGLSGTISGATWTTQGRYTNALSFNGSSGYVDLGNPVSLQMTGSMTLSAWVKATANPPDDGEIIAKSDNAGWLLKSSPDTGPQTFGIAISGNSSSHVQRYSSTVRALNVWYYVAGVYNATTQTLDIYVNGVMDNGVLTGVVPASQYNSSLNVNIGRRSA